MLAHRGALYRKARCYEALEQQSDEVKQVVRLHDGRKVELHAVRGPETTRILWEVRRKTVWGGYVVTGDRLLLPEREEQLPPKVTTCSHNNGFQVAADHGSNQFVHPACGSTTLLLLSPEGQSLFQQLLLAG